MVSLIWSLVKDLLSLTAHIKSIVKKVRSSSHFFIGQKMTVFYVKDI